MGVNGKNTKSIRRKELPSQRLPVIGIKSLKFHHQASAGETGIDLNNLSLPGGTGLVNPSPAQIASINMAVLSENLVLTSNIRPFLMEGLSYQVRNNRINFINGFTPQDGEIFSGLFFNHTVNGTIIADVRTPSGSGVLLESQTDFNLGEAIPIKEAASNQWPIQLYRGTSLTPVLRNAGNSSTGEGNYYMVDRGDGYCQVIRFNDSGNAGGEPVAWATHGALGERPSQSVLQYVDSLAGQLDKVITDLALVTDKDESEYQAAPNNSDLKAFGDLIFKLLNVEVLDPNENSMIEVSSANGYGSTATTTRRFNNVVQNIGTDITYEDDASLGARFIANESGVYHATFSETSTANFSNSDVRIEVDGVIKSFDHQRYNTADTNPKKSSASWSGYLSAGQVVTATVLLAANSNGNESQFTITKIGKRKKLKDLI